MKALNLALFLSILFLGHNALAQSAIENANKLKLPNKKLTILKNKISTNPAQLEIVAGQYEIRPLNTNNCLGSISKGLTDAITGNFGYGLGLVKCGDYTFSKLAIIPRPDKSYTIRPKYSSGFTLNFETYTSCANIARNVIIGPKAIDFSPCMTPVSANKKSDVGLQDQQFTFIKLGENIYQINTFDQECFDVRGQNTGLGTEIVKWACNGQNNQKFELLYIEPLEEGHIINALREDGLY
ncbi:MAG: RICIN domain-containing protein [Caulobacterales bacterium]|nr:RICIN domain-containing protein [Caulobacterales bacterium]